jgi:hypothetical protein
METYDRQQFKDLLESKGYTMIGFVGNSKRMDKGGVGIVLGVDFINVFSSKAHERLRYQTVYEKLTEEQLMFCTLDSGVKCLKFAEFKKMIEDLE